MTITFTTNEPQPPVQVRHVLQVWTEDPADACCGSYRDATPADLEAAGYHRDDPTLDGTDGASPAWWRGVDHGISEAAACLMAVAQDGSCGTIADAGLQATADAVEELRRERSNWEASANSYRELRDDWQRRAEAAESQAAALRSALRDCLSALGNGGAVAESASDDFHRLVAEEVRLSSPTSPDGEQPAEPAGGALRAELDEAIATAGDLNLEVTRLRAKITRQRRELRRLNLDIEHYRRGYRTSTTIAYPVAGPGNWSPVVPETSPTDEAIVDDMVHRATANRPVTRMQPSEKPPWFPRPGERVRVTGVGSAGREFTVRDIDTALACPIIGEDGYQWRVSELEPVSSEQPATGGEERCPKCWRDQPPNWTDAGAGRAG